MRHFFTTKVKVVLILALLITAGLAVATNLLGVTVGDLLVQTIITPLRTGASALTDRAEQLYNYVFEYEKLAAENAALREELSQIRDDSRDAASIKRENDRLRELLQLKKEHEDYELVDAYIITWDSNDWSKAFTINRGTSSGIEAGMCAITESGEVVGVVTEAGSNYAKVKTVLDSSIEISATVAGAGYNGIVKGGYSTESPDKLRMNYLPSAATIHINDQVVTTGSTVYPRNLILGYVIDAGFDDTGVAKFALLEPAADIGSLEQVFIVMDYNAG